MQLTNQKPYLLAFVLSVIFLTGCVAPLKKEYITPDGLNVSHRHSQIVVVNSSAKTQDGERFLDYQDQILQNAIIDGINRSGLFGQALSSGRADYQLDVSLLSIQWPTSGFTMSSSAKMDWKLTRLQDGQVIFQDTIVTEYSENLFHTFMGATRSYEVMRGAIRKNVQEGIEQLGKTEF